MIRRTILLAAVVFAAVQAPAQDAKTLRVYFVGNSVTDTINYRALAVPGNRRAAVGYVVALVGFAPDIRV
jgi:hypothetical protein